MLIETNVAIGWILRYADTDLMELRRLVEDRCQSRGYPIPPMMYNMTRAELLGTLFDYDMTTEYRTRR